jgi:hypothetical protein
MAPNTLRHGAQREDYLHPSPVSQPERWEHRRSSRLNPARGLEHLFAHLACPLVGDLAGDPFIGFGVAVCEYRLPPSRRPMQPCPKPLRRLVLAHTDL